MAILKGLFFIIFMVATILLINLLQMASMVIWPISRKAFDWFNSSCAHAWWGSIVWMMERGHGIKVEITGDPLVERETALVLSNHHSIVDIPAIFCVAIRARQLGQLKWFVKDIVKYIPGPGWGMIFLGCVYVKRNWLKDKAIIDRAFARLATYAFPFWLVSFPEGTRATPEKLRKNQAFSAEKNWPHLKHLMSPRVRGIAASLEALRQRLGAVYDLTLFYPEGVPSLGDLAFGRCQHILIQIKRIPIATIPEDQAGVESFVWELFKEKDQILARLFAGQP